MLNPMSPKQDLLLVSALAEIESHTSQSGIT